MVSVCVLSYNHEKYLRDCLEGIVMQRTTFPIEAWVHDDASTDKSQEIIKEYQQRYPEIIKPILQTENQYSKKEGSILKRFVFPKCTGKYIALCEGDDYWTDPYKLQKQVDFMDTHPDYVACFHNAYVQSGKHRVLFNSLIENHYPAMEDIITRRWFIATASLLYRNIHIEFPEWQKNVISGDYLLELLLAREGKFYYMDDVMSVYRKEGQGISTIMNANMPKMYDGLIYLMTQMKELYRGNGADAFDRAILNYEKLKKESEIELYYAAHPIARAFRLKTYKRAIKRWLKEIVKD